MHFTKIFDVYAYAYLAHLDTNIGLRKGYR